MRRLVEEIVFSTFEWGDGEYRFQSSTGVLDPDVALTLSTAAVIVEGIRRLPESDLFRERLGDGRLVPVLSTDPMSRYQYLPLTPQEAYILSRIDGQARSRLPAQDRRHLARRDGEDPLRAALLRHRRVAQGGRGAAGVHRARGLERRGGRANGRANARPCRARAQHLPAHRLALALRAARRAPRRRRGGHPSGLLRAQPALSPRSAAPGGPGALRKRAHDRLREAQDGARDAVGPRSPRRVRRDAGRGLRARRAGLRELVESAGAASSSRRRATGARRR